MFLLNPLKPGVENEDIVVAVPTGNAPTTFELSTILLPTKVHLISQVQQYMKIMIRWWFYCSNVSDHIKMDILYGKTDGYQHVFEWSYRVHVIDFA